MTVERVHVKAIWVSALTSAVIGGLVTYLGLTFGMSRQIAINTERLNKIEESYITRAQFDQFQSAEMDKWQQWIQEARDTRSDLRGFSEQMNRFSVEHARILMMLQRHSGVEKKPSMYSDLPQSYESR